MKRALFILAIAACSPPSDGPKFKGAGATSPHRGGTLRFSIRDQLPTLDPTIAYDEMSYFALRFLWEPLLDYAPGSAVLIPRLAERWEVSADAMTFTFWLRDSRFSDGTPVVAGDVKYSLERALKTPDSPFGQWLTDVVGAADVVAGKAADCAGIKTPTDHELVIQLARPNAGFIYTLAAPFTAPQRRTHVESAGDDIRREPLGNGPYALATWSEGERLSLKRSATYAGTQPAYPDAIEMLEAVPRDTQFMMLEQGELDTASRLSAPDLLWVRSQPKWLAVAHTTALLSTYGARFDVTQKPFDDVRVRRAFNYAIDRDHAVKLLAGTAVPAHGMLPPGVPGRSETLTPYPHDPAKARALLHEAGYDHLSLMFMTLADEDAEKLAASYRADLAEVGVTLNISVVPLSVYLSTVGEHNGPALSYAGWTGDSPDPTSFLDVKFHSQNITENASINDSFYVNKQLDGLLDTARADADSRDRIRLYSEAEQLLADDPPWMFVYHETMTEVSQPYVHDAVPHPVWIRDFSNAWLDLDENGERVAR